MTCGATELSSARVATLGWSHEVFCPLGPGEGLCPRLLGGSAVLTGAGRRISPVRPSECGRMTAIGRGPA